MVAVVATLPTSIPNSTMVWAISGLSPAIAQTIVELGIDVGKVTTTATMQDALVDVFKRLGLNFGEER